MLEKNFELWTDYSNEIVTLSGENHIQTAIYNLETPTGNCIVILKDDSIETISQFAPLVKRITKKLPIPLFLSDDYIHSSLDSFPLEFLNIQKYHKTITAKADVITHLKFEKSNVRLKIETELKGKLVLIKTAMLENFGKQEILTDLIRASFSSIIPVLKGLLFIAGKDIPENCEDIIKKADNYTKFSLKSFYTANDIFTRKTNKVADLSSFFAEYTEQIRLLSCFVDKEL